MKAAVKFDSLFVSYGIFNKRSNREVLSLEQKDFYNPIREHVFSIPCLVKDEIQRIFEDAESIMGVLRGGEIRRIILTGCGYSYAACLSVIYALQNITGQEVIALPAIDVARFLRYSEIEWKKTLVIAISNSGAVTRVNEALAVCRKQGAITLGLTSNLQGEILKYCQYSLDISSPALGRTLPLRGYAMTIVALLGVGCALNGDAGQSVLLREQLTDSMKELEEVLPEIDRETWNYVNGHPGLERFEFVGSGYERGAAFLGKIEMMGQAGLMAVDEDGEQWLHCNFFMANPEQIGTVLFLSQDSPGASRNEESLFYMKHLQRPVCVVTDDRQIESSKLVQVVHVPAVNPVNAGIVEMIVPSLLTGYYCKLKGEEYSRGFKGRWELFRDGCGTTKSRSDILGNYHNEEGEK